jgi:hypothetical protein
MMEFIDEMIRHLIATGTGISAAQIGFGPPDKDWRQQVSGTSNWLNVYLAELHENRKFRSNDRVRTTRNGQVVEGPVPALLDCHYLISAWSPALVTPLVEPSIDEQDLLYEVARVLMDNSGLDAEVIYGPGNLPVSFPDALLPALPTVVAPPEGFARLADFWMRMDYVWKPVVELLVTVPVVATLQPAGGTVTTLSARFTRNGHGRDDLVAIGGIVRRAADSVPLAGAWVRIVEINQLVTANIAGQFTFVRLVPGRYTLEAGGVGHPARQRTVDIPSPSGEYDLALG